MQQLAARQYGVSLRELFPDARLFGCSDIHVQSVCADWRHCREGDLYVAIDTPHRDGHQDVQAALQKGAVAVLSERLLPYETPYCSVDDTREALGTICHALRGYPARNLLTVGVTGTTGKTVTAHLLFAVLAAAGVESGLISSAVLYDGNESRPNPTHDPTAPQLADQLTRIAANGARAAVIELSSQALAQRFPAGIDFDAGIVTNIQSDHLDFHGSQRNYANAKERLIRQIKPEGIVVVDGDDPGCTNLLDRIDHPALSTSLWDGGEITAQVIEREPSEQTFLLSAGSESICVRTATIGNGHLRSCLLATAYGLSLGIDLPIIASGLESVDFVPGRMERIECGQPFTVIVDNAHTPHQLEATLRTAREVSRRQVICVYGADGETAAERRPSIGRVAERLADQAIITSQDPKHELPMSIAHQLLDGYRKPGRDHILSDRAEAIRFALESAREGDVVVISGKGDRKLQTIGGSDWIFDDRQVCRDILYGNAPVEQFQAEPVIIPIGRYLDN